MGSGLVQGLIGVNETRKDIEENPAAAALNVANSAFETFTLPGMAIAQGRRFGRHVRDSLSGSSGSEDESVSVDSPLSPEDVGNNAALSQSFRRNVNDVNVDAAFNDTPASGILATQEYNTFQFAPGDRVFASQGGGGGGGGGFSAPITITQVFEGTANPDMVMAAAAQGVQSGMDEFVARWQSRNTDPVQMFQTDY
jgi:hypothetical protein